MMIFVFLYAVLMLSYLYLYTILFSPYTAIIDDESFYTIYYLFTYLFIIIIWQIYLTNPHYNESCIYIMENH